jgi:acetylornithine deacetylase
MPISDDADAVSRIHDHGNSEQALAILREAISTPSVTGNEAAYANVVATQLKAVADEVIVDRFGDTRASVWARAGGAGERGRGLVFGGHLDTVHTGGWREAWAGTERESPFSAAAVNGAIWGRGAADQKAGVCAVIAALHQIARAGFRPAAPVIMLFVADEESGEPETGTSEGIRRLLASPAAQDLAERADLAIYTEPTTLQVYTCHMGFFTTEITLTGKTAYFGTPELGVDAMRAATQLLERIYAYGAMLSSRGSADMIGAPFLYPTGVTSGGYIAVPGEAKISLIRKLIPGEDLTAATNELDQVITSAVTDPDISLSIAYPASRDHSVGGTPHVADATLPAIAAVQQAVRKFAPEKGSIEAAPYWSEAPFLAALGIPTVYVAPGDIRTCHGPSEHVDIDEYLAAVAVYAELIATHCGVVETAERRSDNRLES